MGCYGPQLHVGIAKCEPTWSSSIKIVPCDAITITPTIKVQSIEVWQMTAIVPPGSLVVYCTVSTTVHVIVSVVSGKLHTIVSCQAVPCYPYPPVLVPSNSEFVVGAWSTHVKVIIKGILGMACKVIKVNAHVSLSSYWCQTANLLQAQPMLSFHIYKSILIVHPTSVEVLWPVAPSLKHGPTPSIVHVAPDREGVRPPGSQRGWGPGCRLEKCERQDLRFWLMILNWTTKWQPNESRMHTVWQIICIHTSHGLTLPFCQWQESSQ